MRLVLYFLFSYSVTAILMYAQITDWIRTPLMKVKILRELFNCSMCLGFWVALLSSRFFIPLSVMSIIIAVASSGITWLLCSITQCALWAKVYYQTKYEMWVATANDKHVEKEEKELHG
jgi:hypothetical protein